MKSKILLISLVFILVLSVALVVYFSVFTKVTILQDESWKLTMPKDSFLRLRKDLLKEGYRLKVVTLEQNDLTDEDYLRTELHKLDTGGTVIVSPVVSYATKIYDINVKKELLSTFAIGIGNVEDYFDVALVSNTYSAWADMAKSIAVNNTKAAIVYDDSSITEARVIYDLFDEKEVSKYNIEDYGNLFVSEIFSDLDSKEIDIIICPFVGKMDSFFESEDTHHWVTDYRYSQVVPKKNLKGVIAPNIFGSIEKYLNKGMLNNYSNIGELVYEYRSFK